jgi:5'-3' exonuclease
MGVPGFFAWILKNYKKTNMITNITNTDELKDNVSNLFIDTNCLIHPQCFSILAENKDLKNIDRLETKMINQVIKYLSEIIDLVNPTSLIYIAIDGVAPMAKIKHQRTRRFKSVRDNEIKNDIRRKHKVPEENLWSNACITPGTIFMQKLNKAIINYINFSKTKENKNRTVLFSSSNTPAEGEHKVLQYIRTNPPKDTDNSVIYGLDADLLFLSLSTHNKNIYLIRESQELGKEAEITNNAGIESKFNYVSIDLLRKCIINEMIYRNANEGDTKMEEKIKEKHKNFINDFTFVCFLLGNDFVPNILSLNLKSANKNIDNGLDIILEKYSDIFKELNKNSSKDFQFLINNDCTINFQFFRRFCKELANHETDFLKQIASNKRFYPQPQGVLSECELELFRLDNISFKVKDPVMLGTPKDKERYYKHYFDIDIPSSKINDICKEYIYGLYWINNYYMKDCIDWTWCFPHHHGLFISDLSNYIETTNSIEFNKLFVKPSNNNYNKVKPFEQLMMVLPKQLSYMLPIPLKKIMHTDETIKKLSPMIFDQDMLYKTKLWQCIPNVEMIPLEHIQELVSKVTLLEADQSRNKTSKVYQNQM